MLISTEQFFLIVTPGLEQVALAELREKGQLLKMNFEDMVVAKGGVEVVGNLNDFVELNRWLKIPTRILWRVEEFKARDFPKLFNKIKGLDWRSLIGANRPDFHVTASGSRLFDTRRIKEAADDGYHAYFKGHPPKQKDQDKAKGIIIYLRLLDDVCTLSVDLSGDALYKRGQKKLVGPAPLRETLAAGFVYHLMQSYHKEGPITLMDPMCGTGTLLLEAGLFWQPVERYYAGDGLSIDVPAERPLQLRACSFEKLFGADRDTQFLKMAHDNLTPFKLPVELIHKELSAHNSKEVDIVVCNPPFNERLSSDLTYTDIARLVGEKFSPELMGLFGPVEKFKGMQTPVGYEISPGLKITHGGMKTGLVCFKKT